MQKHIYILLFSLFSLALNAQDCYTSFRYFQPLTLEYASFSEMATIAIPFNTKSLVDAGKMREDGADLRITDKNCNELSFFVQGIGDRENNVLYIRLPEIEAGIYELQLYYGNSGMTDSEINGDEVFLFFDDFEDGEVDTNRWEVIGDYELWEEADGELRFTGSFGTGGIFKYVAPLVGYTDHMTFDFAANANNSQIYGVADTSDLERIALRYGTGSQSYDTLDIIALMFDTFTGGTNPGIEYPFVHVVRNDLNIIGLSAFRDQDALLNFTRFINYSSSDQNDMTLTVPQIEYDVIRPFFASFGSPVRVEYVGARKTPSILPDITYGSEVELMSSTYQPGVHNPLDIVVFPNPASIWLTIETYEKEPKRLMMIDINGSIVMETDFTNKLDVSSFEVGLYVIRFIYNDGQMTHKHIRIMR